jgi:hypothetical protein
LKQLHGASDADQLIFVKPKIPKSEIPTLVIGIAILLIFGIIVYREMDRSMTEPNSTSGSKIVVPPVYKGRGLFPLTP